MWGRGCFEAQVASLGRSLQYLHCVLEGLLHSFLHSSAFSTGPCCFHLRYTSFLWMWTIHFSLIQSIMHWSSLYGHPLTQLTSADSYERRTDFIFLHNFIALPRHTKGTRHPEFVKYQALLIERRTQVWNPKHLITRDHQRDAPSTASREFGYWPCQEEKARFPANSMERLCNHPVCLGQYRPSNPTLFTKQTVAL